MAAEKTVHTVPPYLAYATFKNYIATLKTAMPNRIERGILRNMSGVNQTLLLNALRYFNLIAHDGQPTERLSRLRSAEGADRQKQFTELLRTAYPTFFSQGFNLQGATPREMEERFEKLGVSGDTTRKAITFFVLAAQDAGIPVSPYLKKSARSKRNGTAQPRKSTASNNADMRRRENPLAQSGAGSLRAELVAKFPTLDPAWPDDVKAKWFDAFQQLMERVGEK